MSDDAVVASLCLGLLASVFFLLFVGFTQFEGFVSNTNVFGYDVKPTIVYSVRESLKSGGIVEELAETDVMATIFAGEITSNLFPRYRAFYAKEFAPDVNVSVSFDCQSSACAAESTETKVVFNKKVNVLVETTCSKNDGVGNCKISFSDTNQRPRAQKLVLETENSFEKQVASSIEGEINEVVVATTELKRKNALEKSLSFWTGKPTELASRIVVDVARLGVVLEFLKGDGKYFFQAQQKYGLFYPDGSKSPKEFVSNMKQAASMKEFTFSKQGVIESCENELDSRKGLVSKGFEKLFENIFHPCVFGKELDAVSKLNFPEIELAYSFPEGESLKEQVQRAMIVFEIERSKSSAKQDDYPVVSAGNQITWLNATGEETAFELIDWRAGTQIDFSALKKFVSEKDLSVAGEQPMAFDGYVLTVSKKVSARLQTTRKCSDGEECVYALEILAR